MEKIRINMTAEEFITFKCMDIFKLNNKRFYSQLFECEHTLQVLFNGQNVQNRHKHTGAIDNSLYYKQY